MLTSRNLRRTVSFLLMAAILVLNLPVSHAAETILSSLSVNTSSPREFEMVEVAFNLSETYDNPFDPTEVDVRASFLTPSGQTEVVPGFYKQHTSPNWAVRYTPRETGTHQFVIQVTDLNGVMQSSVMSFVANAASEGRGFMTVKNNRILDSHGKQIVLTGTNYAWSVSTSRHIRDAMPLYKASDMNMMRVWQSCWWDNYALEYGEGISTWQQGIFMEYEGIGRYNLENAARMDQTFEAAEDNDIWIMLTLNSFGDFYYDWEYHAYNTENGGPCYWSNNDTDFWTNPVAIEYQKRLLRYNFARYGYSASLGMLEYWNEMDNRVNTSDANRVAWHAEMDAFWKSWDFYQRPTTTSFAWMDHDNQSHQMSWHNLDMLDVGNFHRYLDATASTDAWLQNTSYLKEIMNNKPIFCGEYGVVGTNTPPLGFVHDGTWYPFFLAGAAGAGMTWVVQDNGTPPAYFDIPAEYRAIYSRLAGFIRPEEAYLPDMNHFYQDQQAFGTRVGGYRTGNRVVLLINDPQSPYDATTPRVISGMQYQLEGMTDGDYTVSFYNTHTGAYIAVNGVQSSNGTLTLSIPDFSRDIAVKITDELIIPDTEAPVMPTNLKAAGISHEKLMLSWTASSDNVAVLGYDVYVNGSYKTTSASNSIEVTGLDPNTVYAFTVIAVDAAGNQSVPSEDLQVTTLTAPVVPVVLTPVALTGSANVDPVYPVSNLTDGTSAVWYTIWNSSSMDDGWVLFEFDGLYDFSSLRYQTSQSGWAGNVDIQVSEDGIQFTNVATAVDMGSWGTKTIELNGVGRFVRLYFHNGTKAKVGGQSLIELCGSPNLGDITAPSTPINLSVVSSTETEITVSWDESTDDTEVAGYRVYLDGDLISTTTQTLHILTGLQAESLYQVTVEAFDDAGNISEMSMALQVQTDAPEASSPKGLRATKVKKHEIRLAWDMTADEGMIAYLLFRNDRPIALCFDTGYKDAKLDANTTYSYRLIGINSMGEFTPSSETLVVTSNK